MSFKSFFKELDAMPFHLRLKTGLFFLFFFGPLCSITKSHEGNYSTLIVFITEETIMGLRVQMEDTT